MERVIAFASLALAAIVLIVMVYFVWNVVVKLTRPTPVFESLSQRGGAESV